MYYINVNFLILIECGYVKKCPVFKEILMYLEVKSVISASYYYMDEEKIERMVKQTCT